MIMCGARWFSAWDGHVWADPTVSQGTSAPSHDSFCICYGICSYYGQFWTGPDAQKTLKLTIPASLLLGLLNGWASQ